MTAVAKSYATRFGFGPRFMQPHDLTLPLLSIELAAIFSPPQRHLQR
jgi:hypothetical protein